MGRISTNYGLTTKLYALRKLDRLILGLKDTDEWMMSLFDDDSIMCGIEEWFRRAFESIGDHVHLSQAPILALSDEFDWMCAWGCEKLMELPHDCTVTTVLSIGKLGKPPRRRF
jgi:hypothetical protein